MALHETTSKLLIVVLILIKLSSGEQNVNKPAQSRLTKRHHESDFPPRLTHQPHSVRVKPREPHTVECPVESQPESDVKWFKDGQVLVSEPAHVEQTGSELMFFQINEDDTGDYHCEAENYLGRAASERFRLTVQSSSIQDETISLEPQVYWAAEQQDWPAEFQCTIPVALLGRTSKLWQSNRPEKFVKWHRNGRPLSVSWELNQETAMPSSAKTDQLGRGFRARQSDRSPNEFVLSISRPTRQLDNNSTFTCRLEWDQSTSDESHESRPSLIRFEQPIKLNTSMGPPIDIPSLPASNDNNNNNLNTLQTLDDRERARVPNENQTTQLTGDEQQQLPTKQSGRIRTSLGETLSDLYQIAKPTLILFGVMSLVAVIVLFQFLFVRRRAQANRYMKHHHQYSSSASSANSGICGGGPGSGGSGTSSALGDCDPVLSSLLARTLSAPSAGSLTGANKKYKYYRDHMRGKVAATNDHQLVDGAHHDFIDAAAYFAATHQQQQQDCQASLFAPNNGSNSSAVPNLYNQSLAAREQARTLLQSGEHVRSMGNLTASGQLQRLEHPLSKQHDMIMAGTQQRLGQHHLELPMNFGNSYNSGGPLESGAASLLHHQSMTVNQQQQQQLWPGQHHLLLAAAQQQHQHQQKQHGTNEQYQLVSCSSVSPSSTSSIVAGSNSSSGTGAVGSGNNQEETTVNQLKPAGQKSVAPTRDSISNHYSIIENNDDDDREDREEDERYEELDDREFVRSSARSSATSSSVGYRNPISSGVVDNTRDFNRKTSFGVENSCNNNIDRAQQKSSSHLRSSIISSGSTNSSSGSTGRRLSSAFGSKRAKTNQRSSNQDQLSPYAVSSICHNQQQQPPPVSSEAMRALKEQFDINQLVLIDNNNQHQQQPARHGTQQVDSTAHRLPFNLPPPPPPPTTTDCESMSALDPNRSMRSSKSKRSRQRGPQDD